AAVERLDNREKLIIYLRFFHDLSQTEVAERLNISQMHVSRLQHKALKRLKELMSAAEAEIAAREETSSARPAGKARRRQRPEPGTARCLPRGVRRWRPPRRRPSRRRDAPGSAPACWRSAFSSTSSATFCRPF